MVSFNKPIQSSPEKNLPAKQKCTLNSKLASEDNVHEDAVKQRKLDTTHPKASTSKITDPSFRSATQNPKPLATSKQHSFSCQASVEEVDEWG